MKNWRWMLIGCLGLALLQGCGKKDENASAEAFEKFDSPWVSEEHWMVASTVKDLQGMTKLGGAEMGADAAQPAKESQSYQVGKVVLKMSPSCWNLATYQPLLKGSKLAVQQSISPAPELLEDLLTPTAKNLQLANKVVSDRIKATPAAVLPHEEAAFLLGVFGIRENARQFGDVRPLLCRMTAHLVMADHLRAGAEPSAMGRWAAVLYDYHAGRPLKAQAAMATFPAEGDSGKWKRAMELLITGDWRETKDLSDLSLLEQIAHARAVHVHVGAQEMLDFTEKNKSLQATPEWTRLVSGPGKSVDQGHLAMRSSLGMEFIETNEIFPIGDEPTVATIAKLLAINHPSALVAQNGVPQVISDSDWAGYFRRHFFMTCSDISRFTLRQWDSYEAAVEWEKLVLPYCRKLPDAELIEPLLATRDKNFQEDLRKTADYIRSHPERVPMGLWFDYRFPNLQTNPQTQMPDQVSWFRKASPAGTAHEPCMRTRFTGIHSGDWVDRIREFHQINPWNPVLCYELAENTGNNSDSVKAAWGKMRDYSKLPLEQSLESPSLTPEQRIDNLRLLMTLDPDAGLDLGAALVVANLPEEAIKAYETAYDKAPDRVSVANQTRWMIYYYRSLGNLEKARAVADHNAEVFSETGLDSALAFAIEEKEAKRATRIANDIAERYGNSIYLSIAGWYGRSDPKALKKIFPDGLKEVTREALEAENPKKGSRLTQTSATSRRAGMRAGDVILAIDGKRVETYQQYVMLMSSTLNPKTRIIYRRGKNILEIECMLPDRRLQVGMESVGE